MSDGQQIARLRKERQRSSNKLKREGAGQATVIDQRSNDVENSKLQKRSESIITDKLCEGGAIDTDTDPCNAAQKVFRILVDYIHT